MTKEEREERREYLMQIVRRLPEKPGSYQYYDRNGDIIYVGKAKNLRTRVSSFLILLMKKSYWFPIQRS